MHAPADDRKEVHFQQLQHGQLGLHDLLHALVVDLARGRVDPGPGLRQQPFHLLVRKPRHLAPGDTGPVTARAVAHVEAPLRVGRPAAPRTDHLEVAVREHIARPRRQVLRPQHAVDAHAPQRLAHELAGAAEVVAERDVVVHEPEAPAAGLARQARRVEKLLRAPGVERIALDVAREVIRHAGRHGRVERRTVAAPHRPDQGGAVDRVGDGLAHAEPADDGIAQVEFEPVRVRLVLLRVEHEARQLAQPRRVAERDRIARRIVRRARLQRGRAAGRVVDHLPNDAVEVRQPRQVVVRIALQDDMAAALPLLEAERPCAHRLIVVRVGGDVRPLVQVARDDLAAVHAEVVHQHRPFFLQRQDHGQRIRRRHAPDHRRLAAQVARPDLLDRILDVVRAERVAVVPLDALAQADRPRQVVGRPVERQREARHQFARVVVDEQPVVDLRRDERDRIGAVDVRGQCGRLGKRDRDERAAPLRRRCRRAGSIRRTGEAGQRARGQRRAGQAQQAAPRGIVQGAKRGIGRNPFAHPSLLHTSAAATAGSVASAGAADGAAAAGPARCFGRRSGTLSFR